MGSHSVTRHPIQVNALCRYIPPRDRRMSWLGADNIPRWFTCAQIVSCPVKYYNHLIATRPGVEPTTWRSQVQRSTENTENSRSIEKKEQAKYWQTGTQVRPFFARVNPELQAHEKTPATLLHIWSHPPLLKSHELIAVETQPRTIMQSCSRVLLVRVRVTKSLTRSHESTAEFEYYMTACVQIRHTQTQKRR